MRQFGRPQICKNLPLADRRSRAATLRGSLEKSPRGERKCDPNLPPQLKALSFALEPRRPHQLATIRISETIRNYWFLLRQPEAFHQNIAGEGQSKHNERLGQKTARRAHARGGRTDGFPPLFRFFFGAAAMPPPPPEAANRHRSPRSGRGSVRKAGQPGYPRQLAAYALSERIHFVDDPEARSGYSCEDFAFSCRDILRHS